MKRFYFNMVTFAAILLAVVFALDILSACDYWRDLLAKYTDSADYISRNVGSSEIKPHIWKAQTQDNTTRLIIGDSLCHQMFSGLQEYNDDFAIMGSNAAITMAGQYIFVKEYLEHHPGTTDVFLIALPASLGKSFDTAWGYQYAVMPFVGTDTIHHLEQETLEAIESVYGEFFMRPKIVELIDLSAVNRKLYLNMLKEFSKEYPLENHFSLADQYIVKMDQLCREKGVNFYLYSGPVSEARREKVEVLREEFEASAICSINPDYLNHIYYFPADQSRDEVHFSTDYADREFLNERIREMFAGTRLLELLKFE